MAAGFTPKQANCALRIRWGLPEPSTTSSPLRNFPYTDSGNAERIVARHGQDIRYCYPQKTWYIYDGHRWVPDQQGQMMHIGKCIARSLYAEAAEIEDKDIREACVKFARACESTERKKSALVSAQSEPGIPILPDKFDRDPFLLNCPSGTIDLRRSGEQRSHRREDFITKMSPVIYQPSARSALWKRFLDETTGGDREMQDFLQRAVGYSLTGSVSEEVLFFVHGPGASGKSTFLEAIKAVLGDYAKTADFETFVQRNNAGGVRDDVAELAGRRFVVSIEVEEGRKLAQGLVKLVTGGDSVRARFLYQQGFEFVPQFKLWLAANDAPKVKHNDSAMWRRILRIPFDQVIPKAKRDPSIKARLKNVQECGPAILAWAVEGCLRWQEEGLGVPAMVELATEEYRLNMDPLRDFVADCCIVSTTAWGTSKALRHAYEAYCRDHGEKQLLAPKEFGACLRSRGCEADHRRAGNVWVGIGLRTEESTSDVM
jgi:putative DNA primase/helicase